MAAEALPSDGLQSAEGFLAWARRALHELESAGQGEQQAAFEKLRALKEQRELPRRILGWLEQDKANPPFSIDVQTNPAQIRLASTRYWSLLLYIWLPSASATCPNDGAAHGHSSKGYSLIHTGTCYTESQFRRGPDGRYQKTITTTRAEGELREIAPDLVHLVEPSRAGGFSFIFWGPKANATTLVVDPRSGVEGHVPSEHVDALSVLVDRLRAVALYENS